MGDDSHLMQQMTAKKGRARVLQRIPLQLASTVVLLTALNQHVVPLVRRALSDSSNKVIILGYTQEAIKACHVRVTSTGRLAQCMHRCCSPGRWHCEIWRVYAQHKGHQRNAVYTGSSDSVESARGAAS